tara:strand:- start:1236 stop:2393 length:1158 start_codon:yes stop_codon:yes gene_type:complete
MLMFADLGMQPLANKYPRNKKEIKYEKKFPLKIIFCNNCLAAQIKRIINRKYLFEDYYYLSSVNKGLVDHFYKLSNKIKKNNFVLDIGSNDGVFLQHLKQKQIKFLGVDPSKNVGEIANSRGLTTIIDFFNKRTVNKIISKYGQPDIVVASSIFTHLKDPLKFIENLKKVLKKNGTFILEIEYINSIIKKKQFERFYFDRPFYYSLNSINKLFSKNQLSLVDFEKIDTHGGSIRCYIKNNNKAKKSQRLNKALKSERLNLNKNTVIKFSKSIRYHTDSFFNKISELNTNKKFVIGYGCPARVSTITNLSKVGPKNINFIIDDSPLKANKFSPGMNIPIKSFKILSKNRKYYVIVFAYDYFDDIRKKLKKFNCEFYFPIPFKKINI